MKAAGDSCYIYGLREDREGSLYFYVGSTKHALAWRWQKHKEAIVSGRNRISHFTRVVRSIGTERVRIDLLEEVLRERRFQREAYWIGRLPGLTNIVKNPLALSSGSVISADQVEQKWLAVRDRIKPQLLEPVRGYIEATVKALRVIERELEARGEPLEFSA